MEEAAPDRNGRLERLAALAVEFGANVQPGQIVSVGGELAHVELVRKIAAAAYKRGARFVDVSLFDPHVKRARIEHAREETLEFVPSWYGDRVLQLGEQRCANVVITGPSAPGLLSDLDPERVGRDLLPRLKESGKVVSDRTMNWTIVPYATPAWAALVHPDGDEATALERLWSDLEHVCRLDTDDPVEAWQERFDVTTKAAERLNELRFDALHFSGPGTDLTLGLLSSSRWWNARFETVDGIPHVPNIPSEEVFTSPDPERADGVVRSTKPLVFSDGAIVEGLSVRFEGGRAVQVDAELGAETLRAKLAKDEGAARLGEVALVDGEGRIGALDRTFYDTLIDENAASHIALGSGFAFAAGAEDGDRVNTSAIHIDFMIGGGDVDVTGIALDGKRVPVLRAGNWQI